MKSFICRLAYFEYTYLLNTIHGILFNKVTLQTRLIGLPTTEGISLFDTILLTVSLALDMHIIDVCIETETLELQTYNLLSTDLTYRGRI